MNVIKASRLFRDKIIKFQEICCRFSPVWENHPRGLIDSGSHSLKENFAPPKTRTIFQCRTLGGFDTWTTLNSSISSWPLTSRWFPSLPSSFFGKNLQNKTNERKWNDDDGRACFLTEVSVWSPCVKSPLIKLSFWHDEVTRWNRCEKYDTPTPLPFRKKLLSGHPEDEAVAVAAQILPTMEPAQLIKSPID